MHLVYIDESMDGDFCTVSALAIAAEQWGEALDLIKQHRRQLNRDHGIYVRKEIHAREWVSGRGKIGTQIVPKGRRVGLFNDILGMITTLPGAMLFNAVFGKKKTDWAFERLSTRIHRMMVEQDSHAILLCDEGKEALYKPLLRKMRVHNHIPSKFRNWPGYGPTKNIPADRILEDPIFVQSHDSFFIQLTDCCAYALLRQEKQVPSKNWYGLHKSFAILEPILVLEANPKDPQGIIRVS